MTVLVGVSGCGSEAPASPCGGQVPGAEHRQAQLSQVRLHYVVAGQGPAVVLLHGFPETWLAWRHVIPRLATRYTVIAPDLRGIGCSSLEPAGYDKQTMAADVHRLVTQLGFDRVAVVGHDMGGMVAFAYARRWPGQVSQLVVSGALLPGFGLGKLIEAARAGRGLTHLAWFMQPWAAERISGHLRQFLAGFIGSREVVRSEAFTEYVQAYGRPGRLEAALGQYRTLPQDAVDNRRGLTAPLPMPVLALGGGSVTATAQSLRRVATDVHTTSIPGAGHYVHETRPAAFAAAVLEFLSRR